MFTDIYYDTANFDLTTKDFWLRKRESVFELKYPQNVGNPLVNQSGIDFYMEATDPSIIMNTISTYTNVITNNMDNVNLNKPMQDILSLYNIYSFCTIITNRCRYKLELPVIVSNNNTNTTNNNITQHHQQFYVDIDTIKYILPNNNNNNNSNIYEIGEVELCLENNNTHNNTVEVTGSQHSLHAYQSNLLDYVCTQLYIPTQHRLRGKVLEYIYRYNKTHYQALRNSGQLQSKGL